MRQFARRLVFALLVVILIVGMAACGGPEIKAGTVIAKRFTPAHTDSWVIPMTNCTGGQYSTCYTSYIPMTDYVPDEYEVTLRNCALKEKPTDSCPTEDWDLDPATYGRLSIGEWFVAKQ